MTGSTSPTSGGQEPQAGTQGQQQTPSPATAAQAAQRAQASSYTPPASQEELDRIIGERLARERAKFDDYDDLKAKADKFDEAEAKNKTEAERLADELAKATERATALETQAVRSRVAAEAGLPPELITGSTEDECRAQAEAAKKILDERKPTSGWGKQVSGGAGAPAAETDPIRQLLNAKR